MLSYADKTAKDRLIYCSVIILYNPCDDGVVSRVLSTGSSRVVRQVHKKLPLSRHRRDLPLTKELDEEDKPKERLKVKGKVGERPKKTMDQHLTKLNVNEFMLPVEFFFFQL